MAKMREWGAWVGCGLGMTKLYSSNSLVLHYRLGNTVEVHHRKIKDYR